ncbi:MAG: hypothetical protein ACYCY2_02255 [Acidithiobacillus ferriphilus]
METPQPRITLLLSPSMRLDQDHSWTRTRLIESANKTRSIQIGNLTGKIGGLDLHRYVGMALPLSQPHGWIAILHTLHIGYADRTCRDWSHACPAIMDTQVR